MSFKRLDEILPYAIEAAGWLAEFLAVASNSEIEEEDIDALLLRWEASHKRAQKALDNLRATINTKREQ